MLKIKKFIIRYIIENMPYRNKGKFKEGDIVKYNWMAKTDIKTAIQDEIGHSLLITNIQKYSDNSETCSYVNMITGEQSSCDVFWLTKANNHA